VTLLILLLGLRPALRQILSERQATDAPGMTALPGMTPGAAVEGPASGQALEGFTVPQLGPADDPLLDSLAREVSNSPKDRLAKIVELDPERAVEVLKQWLNEPVRRTT